MTNLERALMVAEKAHAGQSYDIYPYMFHVKQVVKTAQSLGYKDEILVACALHDVLEDSELSYSDIAKSFGDEVAEIVFCVTDELGRSRPEKKIKTYPKIRGNWKACVVKLCDRIANMEHSKKYNNGLYQMYLKEYLEFKNNLKSIDHPREIEYAWMEIEKLTRVKI